MPKGLSLHIGINSVDPNSYAGWSGPLTACEADAGDMEALARSRHFEPNVLLTNQATREAVIKAVLTAASALEAGDLFFLTYSGHGGQLPDLNGDESDGLDETWCLFDGELVDDEIYELLGKFNEGVRIVSLSDSCHSGSVLKNAKLEAEQEGTYRSLPPSVALRTYQANRAMYDAILSRPELAKAEANVRASALLISACQDNQLAADGPFNGRFTGTLLRVWANGAFANKPRGYAAFHRAIAERMPDTQSPNLFFVGRRDAGFEAQVPFTV